jgi:DNA-binding transcriptional MerR regulator
MLTFGRLYSAREMADFARCSLGQLEYLQEIELLVPKQRSREGHDRYDDINLLRLQQIRVGRARGLALEEIRRWLDGCALGISAHRSLEERSLSAASAAAASPLYVETEVKVETLADREAFQREATELYATLSARRRAGAAPSDGRLRRWTERHCCHINRWFCPCERREHLAFGRAIASHPYHAASIERFGRDLPAFMLSVLEANAP